MTRFWHALLQWRLALAVGIISTSIGAGGLFVLIQVLERDDRQAQRSQANYQAIIASCELLNRKIVESQRPPDKKSSRALLIQSILDGMSPAARAEFYRRLALEREAPALTQADCEAEAQHAVRAALDGNR